MVNFSLNEYAGEKESIRRGPIKVHPEEISEPSYQDILIERKYRASTHRSRIPHVSIVVNSEDTPNESPTMVSQPYLFAILDFDEGSIMRSVPLSTLKSSATEEDARLETETTPHNGDDIQPSIQIQSFRLPVKKRESSLVNGHQPQKHASKSSPLLNIRVMHNSTRYTLVLGAAALDIVPNGSSQFELHFPIPFEKIIDCNLQKHALLKIGACTRKGKYSKLREFEFQLIDLNESADFLHSLARAVYNSVDITSLYFPKRPKKRIVFLIDKYERKDRSSRIKPYAEPIFARSGYKFEVRKVQFSDLCLTNSLANIFNNEESEVGCLLSADRDYANRIPQILVRRNIKRNIMKFPDVEDVDLVESCVRVLKLIQSNEGICGVTFLRIE